MKIIANVESVEGGLIVRYQRVVEQKRQVQRVPRELIVAGLQIAQAIRQQHGEDWKGEEGAAEEAKPSLETVYALEPAAVYCATPAALVAAVDPRSSG